MKEETVFVQIASYRDPELLPTLRDLFAKADHPNNLTVCVAWQHSLEDEWDVLAEFENDSRLVILDIPYKKAKGACWARNQIQKHYSGQTYTLQLDSHHRFIQGWDTELIEMYKGLKKEGVEKPLLTAYIASYDPKNDPEGRVKEPWQMNFDRFTPQGVVFFRPGGIENWRELTSPIPARFYSAHFTFTAGIFCKEVPHDPEFYFHGEEISLAIRAYTHGYDLFHPHKVLAWHEYTREGRTKHWDDNQSWPERDRRTFEKLRNLLGIDGVPYDPTIQKRFSKYGLGTKRLLEEWEQYSGIRLRERGVQQYTLDFKPPPNPTDMEDYNESFLQIFRHYLDVWRESVPEDDYEFWAVIFEDKEGKEVYRQDCTQEEIQRLKKQPGTFLPIYREYHGKMPYRWIVWPFSKSKGWCERIESLVAP